MRLRNTSDWPSLRSILLKLMMNAGCNVALWFVVWTKKKRPIRPTEPEEQASDKGIVR